MSPRLEIGRYAEILACFDAFYSWLEPELEQRLAGSFVEATEWQGRQKRLALHDDRHHLRARGIDVPTPSLAVALPDLSTSAACIGAAYVTEGATLGGQYIGPHVVALGFGDARFFSAYRDDVGTRWQQFRRAANATLATPSEVASAVAAAQQTFAALQALVAQHVGGGLPRRDRAT